MIQRAIESINQHKVENLTISYSFSKKEIVNLEIFESRDIISITQKNLA